MSDSWGSAVPRSPLPGDYEVWSVVLDHLTGRAFRVAAQAAVLTAVVGGTIAYTDRAKDVTLVLDGKSVTVQAGSADVRGLLADEGVVLGARDLVAPAPETPLTDGQRVVVRFARPLTVTVDGVPRTHWTTELTVDDALQALGIRADGARVSSRSLALGRSGLDVTVSHPKTVTLAADGRTRQVTTSAATVGELLTEQGVAVRPADRVSALPSSPVVQGVVVAVTRIDRRQVTVTEKVAPPVTERPDAALETGRRTVVTAGRPGSRTATYTVVLADGEEASRALVSADVVRKPVGRVVRVGTKATPKAGPVGGGADGLNWSALARCESGGNPRAVNPAGYYGLYQFSPSTWHAVGGSGMPNSASPSEQLFRAKLLYKRSGAGQWGCGRHLFD
jgi:uncharacterized protein YabE (DUF348 family)